MPSTSLKLFTILITGVLTLILTNLPNQKALLSYSHAHDDEHRPKVIIHDENTQNRLYLSHPSEGYIDYTNSDFKITNHT